MAGSQNTYASLIGKFRNGLTVLQSWADYLPSNPSIQIATLVALENEVETKNTAVTVTNSAWLTKTDERKKLFYYDKKIDNRLCFEARLEQITNLVGSMGEDEEVAYDMLKAMQKKFIPGLNKKKLADGTYKTVTPQNRTYASVSGFLTETIAIITNIPLYNPPNVNLTIAAMQNLFAQIETANAAAQTAHANWSDAVTERRKVYQTMSKNITLIKNYLASFDGAKKSNHYIGFVQALKS